MSSDCDFDQVRGAEHANGTSPSQLHSLVGSPGAAATLLDQLLRFSGDPRTELPRSLVFATHRGDARWVERALFSAPEDGAILFRSDTEGAAAPFHCTYRGKQQESTTKQEWRRECTCGDRGMCNACKKV